MTHGQRQQLQDLGKCWGVSTLALLALYRLGGLDRPFYRVEKRWLNGMTHQYRNQIRVIKRNQKAAE
jgi:hypothetical protein